MRIAHLAAPDSSMLKITSDLMVTERMKGESITMNTQNDGDPLDELVPGMALPGFAQKGELADITAGWCSGVPLEISIPCPFV